MLSKGHFIGEILDDLTLISAQVDARCALGLTDLNKYLEEFFCVLLNKLLGLSLVNLNETRSNEPGLDLGDRTAGRAFQITSVKTSAKVNETLKKITKERLKDFPKINVLVIGKRQGSYTLEQAECDRVGFTQEDIWDIQTLCKHLMDKRIDELKEIYDYLNAEGARVRIELEVPTEDGNYPTSFSDHVEPLPVAKFSNFEAYKKFQESTEGLFEQTTEEIGEYFKSVSDRLIRLPRITRECLVTLLERSHVIGDRQSISVDYIKRACSRYPDLPGEIRLLTDENFVRSNPPHDEEGSPYYDVRLPAKDTYFTFRFLAYAKEKGIALSKPLVKMDFSDF